jgi:hypothetical protein
LLILGVEVSVVRSSGRTSSVAMVWKTLVALGLAKDDVC